jgi:23S rRNA (guanosine2251-2'-O)-methyltransferase
MIFYGRNSVDEALNSTLHNPRQVYLQEDINENAKIQRILIEAQDKKIPIKKLPRTEITRLCKSDDHQGVAIDLEFKESNLKDLLQSSKPGSIKLIYIYSATYEHNIGAISRSAEVAGLSGVVVPKTASITPTVAKTSAGAIFHIPIIKLPIFNAIKLCKSFGLQVIGIERDGENYYTADLTGDTLFIIGGEDKGLPDQIREKCDQIVEIPQFGKVNSLNMSVAASIIFFEKNRQEKNS